MLKTIQIKITSQGHAVGTVGWLADTAASIHIGRTRDGKEGAWLCDASGTTITALAIRGWHDDLTYEYPDSTRIATLDRCADLTRMHGVGAIGADIPWTDAGWEAVSRLAEMAVDAIEAKLAEDDDHDAPSVEAPAP